MAQRVLMKGNEAIAEAAIRAGCRHYFGYPITPQTEIAAYMAKKMPKIGTGKTYLAVAAAVAAFRERQVNRIILTRPAVEAGERLGFLPGDLQNKVALPHTFSALSSST